MRLHFLLLESDSDGEYLAAVERGDMATAQRMVDEAARKAGYNIGPAYHGTSEDFTEFAIENSGMPLDLAAFFSSGRSVAERFANNRGGDRVIEVALKIDRPVMVGEVEDEITAQQLIDKLAIDTLPNIDYYRNRKQQLWRYYAEDEEILQAIIHAGYDGMIGTEDGNTLYAIFSP